MMKVIASFVLIFFLITQGLAQIDFPADSYQKKKLIYFDKHIRNAFRINNYEVVTQYYDSINNTLNHEMNWPYPYIKMAIYSYHELIKNIDESLESKYADKIDQLYQLGLKDSNEEIMKQGWTKQAILSDDNVLYMVCDTPPSLQGGMKSFYQYVNQNLQYPDSARVDGTEGKVFVQFVVGKDGDILAVKTIRGLTYGFNQEAERVIRESPDWEPGRQGGKPVYVQMVLPISFELNRKDKRRKKESR